MILVASRALVPLSVGELRSGDCSEWSSTTRDDRGATALMPGAQGGPARVWLSGLLFILSRFRGGWRSGRRVVDAQAGKSGPFERASHASRYGGVHPSPYPGVPVTVAASSLAPSKRQASGYIGPFGWAAGCHGGRMRMTSVSRETARSAGRVRVAVSRRLRVVEGAFGWFGGGDAMQRLPPILGFASRCMRIPSAPRHAGWDGPVRSAG